MTSKNSSGAEIRIIKSLTGEEIQSLTHIINTAYNIGERGFWVPQWRRTTAPEVTKFISEGKMVGAFLDNCVVGCVRACAGPDNEADFGMLAVDDSLWGSGLGRELVEFVEGMFRERGVEQLKLEVVVPRTWVSESKEFLKGWYERRGYVKNKVGKLEELHGTEVFLRQLVTEVDVVFYTKVL